MPPSLRCPEAWGTCPRWAGSSGWLPWTRSRRRRRRRRCPHLTPPASSPGGRPRGLCRRWGCAVEARPPIRRSGCGRSSRRHPWPWPARSRSPPGRRGGRTRRRRPARNERTRRPRHRTG
ncbi:MAG: hypothetical protein E6G27_05280 [Actinobacteria bacterium]|nr:MAG: hypothetical protein E6G27_05280 [Actinomycetota bacterium]